MNIKAYWQTAPLILVVGIRFLRRQIAKIFYSNFQKHNKKIPLNNKKFIP